MDPGLKNVVSDDMSTQYSALVTSHAKRSFGIFDSDFGVRPD